MTARPDAQTAAEDLLITVECLDAAGQQARCPMRYPVSADPHLVKLIATDGDGNSGAPRPRRWHQLRRRVIAARDCPGFCYLTIRIFDDDEDDGERSCEAGAVGGETRDAETAPAADDEDLDEEPGLAAARCVRACRRHCGPYGADDVQMCAESCWNWSVAASMRP